MNAIKSFFIWLFVITIILLWIPVVGIVRLLERDPAHYKTGYIFRRLGVAITKIIPTHIDLKYDHNLKQLRKPVIVVSNHQSNGDIPLIANLPFEMKWVAKKALFKIPVVGWMMSWAGDISVDRKAANRRTKTFRQVRYYLNHNCPVIFFPEGTRSRNGNLNRFNRGAFDLSVEMNVPILPIVLDGTQQYLPKKSWKFGEKGNIKLETLDLIYPNGKDCCELMNETREAMKQKLAEWRRMPANAVDNMVKK